MIISFVIAVIVVVVDQLTKFLIYGTPARSIIGNLLWFQSTLNTGVAFSMFENMTWFFAILSAIATIVLSYLIISKKFFTKKTEIIILGFILGGTFGNLIDRVIFSGVRDFIYLKFLNFAIFNIADMAISLGAITLCIIILINEIKNSVKLAKSADLHENNAKTDKNESNLAEKQENDTEINGENK